MLHLLVLHIDQLFSRPARGKKGCEHVVEGDECQGVGNVVADHVAALEGVAVGAFFQFLLHALASSRPCAGMLYE